jgi:hypothetical protein
MRMKTFNGSAMTLAVLLTLSGAAFAAEAGSTTVTFAKDVAPIFQAKCEVCHRPGQGAPMSLQTYEEARPWARAIRERVITQTMPPWHLDKTVGIQQFSNDRSLSKQQIDTIVKWVDQGAQVGDKKDLPPAKVWPDESGWQLAKVFGREPDLVVKSAPWTVPAVGQDEWWRPTTDIGINEERWVRAVEIRPSTLPGRKVTHHVLASLIQTEPDATDAAAALGGPGLLMEWAIGKNYDIYREGSGKLLEPGAKIRWEVHYHSIGEAIASQAELAIYLYPKEEKPAHRTRLQLLSAYATNNNLDIPPNSIASTQAYHVLRSAARLENFQPHMHLRGKGMSMEAILPDGSVRMLSYVDKFNFNWMNNYIYTDDVAPVLPKGTILHITAYYDNTPNNPNNPDPNQWVGYGDRTVDEMGHAWVNVTNLTEEEYADWVAKHKPATQRAGGAR